MPETKTHKRTDKAAPVGNSEAEWFVEVALEDLDISEDNVRAKHSAADIADMAASIKSVGVVHAPLVVISPTGKHKVIAGGLRVAGARKAGLETITCKASSEEDHAKLIEISLAENVKRTEMTDLQQHVAFTRLANAGQSVDEIAHSFKMKAIEVRRALAIGGLPKKIISLAEAGTIYFDAPSVLTTASESQLDEYLKMSARARPKSGYKIREWLEKEGKRVPVKHALFDVKASGLATTGDLFQAAREVEYFVDVPAFWELQEAKIQERIEKLEAAGWPVERIKQWWEWDYQARAKGSGGKVFIVVKDDGLVTIKRGFVRKGRAGPAQDAGPAPELSASHAQYVRAQRHVALQYGVSQSPTVALRLAIALLLANTRGVSADREDYSALSVKQQSSIEEMPERKAFLKHVAGIDHEVGVDELLSFGNSEEYAAQLLGVLACFTEEDLETILAAVVADRLQRPFAPASTRLEDELAEQLELEDVPAWRPDAAFLSGIRNRKVLIAMLQEIDPKGAWSNDRKSTLAQLRKSIEKLAPPAWRPAWLRFPLASYLKRPGVRFLEND